MLLIYTHKITPRFSYTAKQVFTRILGIEVRYTTTVEDFIKHNGPKITYTKQPLQNEFFIRSNDLLFEQGINDIPIVLGKWDETSCFFSAGERSNIPYDILSASFYLLSRYEEYAPHIKDMHGRFPPTESLAFKNGFLELPVVDIWAHKLFQCLKERFPNIEQKKRNYRYTSILDVTTSHCFTHRGLMRSLAGFVLDLGSFRLKRVWQRFLVLSKLRKDPYDNFTDLISMHKEEKVKSMFFFQFASYSTYDKNVSPNNNKFKYLIKSVADYSKVSLSASYDSFRDTPTLKQEKKQLAAVINRPVNYSRLRYNRVDIPHTYRNLVEAEFIDDFTMGYSTAIGFRAGTSIPFYFYDINLEVQQPLKVHPFAMHDYAFRSFKNREEIMQKVLMICKEVRTINGDFTTVFSNELLGSKHKVDWKALYLSVLKNCNV